MKDDRDNNREREKRAIFDGMSARRRDKILKKVGYENWNPFQVPKEPVDLRDHKTEHLASLICKRFLNESDQEDCTPEYRESVKVICKGLLKGEEKYRAMYDFCRWYGKIKEDISSL